MAAAAATKWRQRHQRNMIGRKCASFNIGRRPFAAEHIHRRNVNVASLVRSSSSSSCSVNDAAMPAKGAVMDRLLTSQLPNEIMIMNTSASVSGQADHTDHNSRPEDSDWPPHRHCCMRLKRIHTDRENLLCRRVLMYLFVCSRLSSSRPFSYSDSDQACPVNSQWSWLFTEATAGVKRSKTDRDSTTNCGRISASKRHLLCTVWRSSQTKLTM